MIERIPEPYELFEQHDREMERRHQLHKSSRDYTFAKCLSEEERKLEERKWMN